MRPLLLGAWVLGVLLWYYFVVGLGPGTDVAAYAAIDLDDPYVDAELGRLEAYYYSPLFAQATEPLRWMGTDAFVLLWRLVNVAVLVVMAGPLALPMLFVPAAAGELRAGNIHPLLAAAILVGFRWPGAWAFVLLTKVTPGIGLLWFAVRREWRSLAIAGATTAGVVAASAIVAPGLWAGWLEFLLTPQPTPAPGPAVISIPFLPRFAAAIAIVIWGARTNRRWTVPLAATLALPSLWVAGLSMLVAIIPLVWLGRQRTPAAPAPPVSHAA